MLTVVGDTLVFGNPEEGVGRPCPVVGRVYQEVDGFYVFEPLPGKTGFWSEHLLRSIADKLAELNKPWQEEINKYFDANPPHE